MSQKKNAYGDISFLLLGVPFVASAGYALYLWSAAGFSAVLPQEVFVAAASNQWVFLVGTIAVLASAFLEVSGAEQVKRAETVSAASGALQGMAIVSFILAFLAAWYSTGFSDPGGAIVSLLTARYPIIFPGLLILLSFLILPQIKAQKSQLRGVLVVLVFLAVPATIYEVGKRDTVVGLLIGLTLMVAGAYLILSDPATRAKGQQKQRA